MKLFWSKTYSAYTSSKLYEFIIEYIQNQSYFNILCWRRTCWAAIYRLSSGHIQKDKYAHTHPYIILLPIFYFNLIGTLSSSRSSSIKYRLSSGHIQRSIHAQTHPCYCIIILLLLNLSSYYVSYLSLSMSSSIQYR